MSQARTTTYLITGCGRGIGRALAEIVLKRPNTVVIGLVRDPRNEKSLELQDQTKAEGSKVILIRYDAADNGAARSAVTELRQRHPEIVQINVVIANAGIAQHFGPSIEASAENYLRHFQVNTLGPLALFKALLPLLQRSDSEELKSKFIAISSAGGSTGLMLSRGKIGSLPYGMSKAALNHCISRLRFEYPTIAFRVITPGATRTGFGGNTIDWSKVPHALSIEEVAPQLLERIDEFTDNPRGETVEFKDWKGYTIPW